MVMLQQALGIGMPDAVSQSIRAWQEQQEQSLRTGYETFEDYYRGQQKTALTDRIKKFLLNNEFTFRDNFCEAVVDALAERLNVIGVESDDENVGAWTWDLWQDNRMDATQVIVHTEAIMKGDAYVLVSWDEAKGTPRIDYQDAHMIIPHYDPTTRVMDWASKKWSWIPNIGEEALTRLNLYYADRVEKYVVSGGNWQRFQEEGDLSWPVPWIDGSGDPLGVPLIHFRNRPLGGDFGISELENVIPMQDLLNKTLIDLVQILDTQAFSRPWTVGVNPPAGGFSVVPGAVWNLTPVDGDASQTKVGQFQPSDVSGVLASIEMIIQHIAGRSRTPQHIFHITGNFPSGEALKTAEAGLINKAKQRQVVLGNAWEDSLGMALKLQNTFGNQIGGEEDIRVEMIWDDPETRNEKSFLEGLEKKLILGIPQRQIWREMGYDQNQIDQMEQDQTDEKVAQANIGSAILESFQRGEEGQV